MKILITGAAGWIGRYVTAALSENEVVLFDHVDPAEATVYDPHVPGNRRREPLDPHHPYVQASIEDRDAVRAALGGVDAVVHLAAMPSGKWESCLDVMQANVMGTTALLEQVRDAGVRRFVNASSINAFGTFYWRVSGRDPVRSSLPLTELTRPAPEDPYSLSKFLTEETTAAYARAFGIEVANLRFGAVWSEEKYDETLQHGLEPTEQWRRDLFQWVHVLDVAGAVSLAVTNDLVTPQPVTICAADSRVPEPTMELIAQFRPDLVQSLTSPLPGRTSLVSIAAAQAALGYAPAFDLESAAKGAL